MPRFFFQVEGPPDDWGTELPDLAAAKCEAVRYAGRLICEEAERFWDTADFAMTVTDENGLRRHEAGNSRCSRPPARLMSAMGRKWTLAFVRQPSLRAGLPRG
jgi:hypothetical protein